MSRLADYFVIVGYDHEKDRAGTSCGKILQRFPETDWDDAPFIEGIELFCQPQGWSLSKVHQEPKYFVSVLTDIDANRHYCACLSFSETEAIMPTRTVDDEDLDDVDAHHHPHHHPHHHLPNCSPSVPAVTHTHHSIMYAPKCLVLVSRLSYFETFRNCLGIIYTVYIESMAIPMEALIGNMLGCVQVPPPGGPQVRFSIGAGDRQALQPPLSNTLPVTHHSVATLFQQLGIHNVLTVFCAAITEQKIVFHSCSYSRLTDSCHAVISLLYPFKYSHVYIPLLPTALIEFLSTPTPFIMGIHSSLKNEISDLMDVIIVDLDGGSLFIPECINLAMLPEPHASNIHSALSMVLHPELVAADNAFLPCHVTASPPVMLDKEIRAIFLQLFAQLLQGYRSCLTIIRIHPKPFISFHKAAFLGQRNMTEETFMIRVLDCMFFNTFVAERGPPYRVCDIFDELYASTSDSSKCQNGGSSTLTQNNAELAQQLYQNENPNPQPYVQKIPKPTEGASTRIHLPPFPNVDAHLIKDIIAEGLATNNLKARLHSLRPQQPRIVPLGSPISSLQNHRHIVNNSARRLEVLRNCINCIFENKILDARKSFPAVLRALKSKVARLALCRELAQHVIGNKAMLEHQQFDLVVRLMNSALQDDSHMDEHGVAAALLPLSTAFCRKLCTGVIQFAYTCIQDHPVWNNLQFWEATFYQDVQKDIKALYLPRSDAQKTSSNRDSSTHNAISPRENKDMVIMWNKDRWHATSSDYSSRQSTVYLRPQEPSALEIAAEQMRMWPTILEAKQEEMIANEESTVYSQAIHYANRIVYLRVPLDLSSRISRSISLEGESNSNSNVTNSVAESDSLDAESGFEEDTSEVGTNVIRFVARFVDKVCTESGVTEDHIKALHQMIPGVVAMHMETLEAVSRESKRLPPIQKPKILAPELLPGEELILEGLRVYLIPDGREEGIGGLIGGPTFLPAEGAVFLTNYRIIFKGTPCDSYASELGVIRCFPLSTLTKEKRISSQYLAHLDQYLQEGLQLRSNTFQLIKVGFDEEVTSESIETFRKVIHRFRNPPTIFNLFAFAGQEVSPCTPLQKQKEKNATLRQFAKKTLFMTAVKAGLKPKPDSRKQKYSVTTLHSKSMTTPGRASSSLIQGLGADISHLGRPLSVFDDDGSMEEDSDVTQSPPMIVVQTDSKTLEKMTESSYCRDFQRLGLSSSSSGSSNQRNKLEQFRVTTINSSYAICRSYPALLVVPQNVSDDSIRKLCRCYRHNRFPVITWRHPRTKALLLRSGSFHGKGVMGMLKGHQSSTSATSETSATIEQEKLMSAVVHNTPLHNIRQSAWTSMNDSSLSINSLVLAAAGPGTDGLTTLTPESSRRMNPFSKAVNTLRSSGGKTSKPFPRWGSLKDRGSSSSLGSEFGMRSSARHSDTDSGVESAVHSFRKAAVYVFGEKAQIKGVRQESYPMCDFIPMDFHEVRHIKASFKKLMRACVPSSVSTDAESSFLKAVENSEWITQLQTILQIAGAAVDLIDVQGSSVIVCLEDGWDITTQIVSVAQVCLDPYYRSMEGFRTLIEKEWLGFGHRFTHRGNHTATTQASGFAPVFLQFLDVVHQIHHQFPLSFEFNQYFLKFLAYHCVSCRFRTFMLDSEFERMEAGWLLEERAGKHRNLDPGGDEELGMQTKIGHSLWDYIDKFAGKSPVFYNFYYCPDQDNLVLRPYSNVSNLNIWDYFVCEDLSFGPSYDLEMTSTSLEEQEFHDISRLVSNRRIVNSCYDDVPSAIPDAFTYLLKEIHRLELELGHLPQKWKILWDKIELPNVDSLTRQASFTTQMIRSHGRSFHKRSTIEILVKGKMVGEAAQLYSHPHRFERYTYTTPTYCDYCAHILWGLVRTGMRCVDCGYNCHEKCMESVPKNCTKYKSLIDNGQTTMAMTKATSGDSTSVASSVSTIQSTSQYYDQFSSNVAENRTHEGYLFKRGALLKGWKQRWFVLDSIKHQMRYYDAMEDSHCKGFIDLAEVVSVTPAMSVQGAPKRADDKAFFDLKTTKRTYNFLASDPIAAQEWVEKIQASLQ